MNKREQPLSRIEMAQQIAKDFGVTIMADQVEHFVARLNVIAQSAFQSGVEYGINAKIPVEAAIPEPVVEQVAKEPVQVRSNVVKLRP